MSEPAVVLRAAGFLALLVISGWAVARVGRRDADLFASVWWALAVTSVSGVLLARSGRFSLMTISIVVAGVGVVAAGLGAVWPWSRRPVAGGPVAPRRVRVFAGIAAVATCVWCWPPFETFIAASDSTMYVNAGIHLARTGTYEVADTITRLVPPEFARTVFASIGSLDQGPYLRLPGGLLMSARDATAATPAFFPLLPVWTGVLSAIGGPDLAPAIAPLGMALAVWALTLFAGESFGLVVAVPTALIFGGNFAVWWFGRFAMSEALTVAFIWGSLVFLGRGAPLAAGMMLGLGGLARAETMFFMVAALACWAAWTPVRTRDLLALIVGASVASAVAAVGLLATPSHHVAYLMNDAVLAWMRLLARVMTALWDGRVLSTLALLPLVPLTAAVTAAWRGMPVARTTIRVLLILGIGIVMQLYLRFGGRAEPLRHLGWLATSMSSLGLVIAIPGTVLVWRRGGSAARLGVILLVLVAAIFIPTPRVANFQPWAMRRFLPVVLPGLALGAGMAIGTLLNARRQLVRAIAAVALVAIVGWQLRPTLAARDSTYFKGSLASVRQIADAIPPDAFVVVEGGLAELQIQVPLWLVYGRESIMVTGGNPAWRALLPALVASGHPTYWLQPGLAVPPQAESMTFTRLPLAQDLKIDLPDSPANTPPAVIVRKIVPLGLYGVTLGDGDSG